MTYRERRERRAERLRDWRARRPGNRPTHVWRLDRETGEAWHWLASDGEQAREIIGSAGRSGECAAMSPRVEAWLTVAACIALALLALAVAGVFNVVWWAVDQVCVWHWWPQSIGYQVCG